MTQQPAAAAFTEWCIVEMLGHRRLAGLLREVQLAGAGFLRLDIPEHDSDPARTQYLAPSSIYAIHPCTEATARRAAAAWRPQPVQRWELPAEPARPAPAAADDDEDLADVGDRWPAEDDDWGDQDRPMEDVELSAEDVSP